MNSADYIGTGEREMATRAQETLTADQKRKLKQPFKIVSPSDYFSALLNEEVVVRTSNSDEITGYLAGFDVNCNCVLINAHEKVNGEPVAFYDRILIKGQRINSIHGVHEKHSAD
ncbi:MAG: LSM domain-containing protein [Halobacteriota archaeon]